MAVNEIWGIDQAYIQSFTAEHVKIGDDSSEMISTDRLAVMLDAAAGRVNGMITGIWGADSVAAFAANTGTAEGLAVIANVKFCIFERLNPLLLAATHGHPPVADEIDDLELRLRNKVRDLQASPEILGDTTDDTYSGVASNSVAQQGIDTSTSRSLYDGYTDPSSGRRQRRW